MSDGTITFRLAQFIDWVSEEAGGCIRAKKMEKDGTDAGYGDNQSRGANAVETDADRFKKKIYIFFFKEMRTLTGNQWC